jgi:hypothetical protein
MRANYQQATRSPLRPIHRLRIKCPVCGKPDNCAVSEDRTRAYCRRTASSHQGRDGGWLHILEDTPRASYAPQQQPQQPSAPMIEAGSLRADVEHVHKIYSILIRARLVLSEEHRRALMMRGLAASAIERNGYRSTPTALYAATVTRLLSDHHDLTGVPGFFKDHGAWRMVPLSQGVLIPVRDSLNRIQALMIRRDGASGSGKYIWLSSADRDGGASSGAPSHYANALLLKDAREVTLTEGALKSQIAAHLLNSPVIGNAPSCFGADFAANLKRDFPQLRTAFVAFDMDFKRNEHVKAALFRLVEQLEKARFDVRVRTWPDRWKGIDDYLLGVSQQEVAA